MPHPQIEELPAGLPQALVQVRGAQGPDFGYLHPWTSRVTKRVAIGSLKAPSLIAARASASRTPAPSKRPLPGLTTATQNSGFPFPPPIRVSRGFLLTGLSGKTRIHILPPRFR